MSDFKPTDKLLLRLHLELDRLEIRERLLQKGYLPPLEEKDEMVHPERIRPPGKLATQFIAQARKGTYTPPPGRPEPAHIPFEKERGEAAATHREGVLVGTKAVGESEMNEIEEETRNLVKWQQANVLIAKSVCDRTISELSPKVRTETASKLEEEDYWYYSAFGEQLEYWHNDVFLEPLPEYEESNEAIRSDYGPVNQGPALVGGRSELSAITGLSKWEDLRITFITDDLVEIRIRDKPAEERTSVGLGLGHLQTGQPTILWKLLKVIALLRGELPYDHTLFGFYKRATTEQRLSRLRRVLKERFGLRSDPIPWTKTKGYKGYRCTFELKVADELRDLLEMEYRTD